MSSPPDPFAHARELAAAGRRADARAVLERVGAHPAATLYLAELEIGDGLAAQALVRLERLGPDAREDVAFLVAQAQEALGRLDAARDGLLAARSRVASPSAALEMQLGVILEKMGDLDGAIAAMTASVALRPDVVASQRNLAAVLVAAGQTAQARDALLRAVALLPHDASLWLRLAAVYTQLGDANAALQAVERAVFAMPVNASAWRDIGHAYAEYWRYEEADRALALASTLDPGEPQAESLRSMVKQELGDTAGALDAVRRVLQRS